ncbi:MAG: hypothetical protein U0P45_13845 [Acidimicrobiales bacterium]
MIHRLLFVVRRRWPILVVLPFLAALAAYAMGPTDGSHQAAVYGSTAVISADQAGANQTEVQQALVKATKGKMAAATAAKVGDGTTPEDVARHIETDFDVDTFVATAVAKAGTPELAQAYAKAFAETFVDGANNGAAADGAAPLVAATKDRDAARTALQSFLAQHDAELSGDNPPALLASERESLQTAYNDAEAKLSDLQASMRPTSVYEVVSVSKPRLLPASKLEVFSSPLFRVGLGLQLGLLAAILVVFIAERMNPRIDDPSQVEALVAAPVLAMVPVVGRRRRGIIERVDPDEFRGPFAESFRTMRAHLDFRSNAAGLTHPPRIMVASATPSEGKTTTAAFLALSYAETDRQPVVIGGDLRRPTIHRLFGIDRVPGLTTRGMPGGETVPLTRIVRHDPVSGVTVVPSGPSVDSVTSVTRDLTALTQVAQQADQVVILDTAPVRVANDAIDFLPTVDWVVVVVKAGKSTARSVKQMMHMLQMNGAQVVGVAMVGSVESSDATRDYYSYYSNEVRRPRRRSKERPAPVAAAS